MRTVALPRIGTAQAWRDAARGLLAEGVRPEDVLWSFDDPAQVDLFAAQPRRMTTPARVTVSKSFIDMANRVVWHSDTDRFARLYAFLWRLRDAPSLMHDRGAGWKRT